MLLHEFPNLDWLKRQAESRFANRVGWNGAALPAEGWPTVILHVDTAGQTVYRDNIPGPLSFFTNLAGGSRVSAGSREVLVNNNLFFLSNPGQRYTLTVDPAHGAQTCNIHFSDHFADEVRQAWMRTPEQLLDNMFVPPPDAWAWHNALTPRTEAMDRILALLTTTPAGMAREALLHSLVICLLQQEKSFRKTIGALPPLRSATREEVFRRLQHATDYIYAFCDRDLSLAALAEAACLSKFHFLRLFKAAYGKTPHHFINEVRVQRSLPLLQRGMTVHAVARAVGFDHPSSFSRMFYGYMGRYPTQV